MSRSAAAGYDFPPMRTAADIADSRGTLLAAILLAAILRAWQTGPGAAHGLELRLARSVKNADGQTPTTFTR
jgi:hypothetical protein